MGCLAVRREQGIRQCQHRVAQRPPGTVQFLIGIVSGAGVRSKLLLEFGEAGSRVRRDGRQRIEQAIGVERKRSDVELRHRSPVFPRGTDEDLGLSVTPSGQGERQGERYPVGMAPAARPSGCQKRRPGRGSPAQAPEVTTRPCGSVDYRSRENEVARIDRLAVDLDLVVEMGTGCDARFPDLGDLVAPRHRFSDADHDP